MREQLGEDAVISVKAKEGHTPTEALLSPIALVAVREKEGDRCSCPIPVTNVVFCWLEQLSVLQATSITANHISPYILLRK